MQSHNQKAGSGDATRSVGSTGPKGHQSTGRKGNDKMKPSEKSASFLVSTLEVLEALIKLASSTCSSVSAKSSSFQSTAAPESSAKGTLLVYPLKKTLTSLGLSSKTGGDSGQLATSGVGGISDDTSANLLCILHDVCKRLTTIWSGLVHEGSVISKHSFDPLCIISRIGVILSELIPALDSAVSVGAVKKVAETDSYNPFLTSFFSGFPYVLFDATVALPGSNDEVEAMHLASMLNIAVCEAALLWFKKNDGKVSQLASTENEKQLVKAKPKAAKNSALAVQVEQLHATMSYVHTSLTLLNDVMSNLSFTTTTLMTDGWGDHLQRLFHCISLEVLFLSDKSAQTFGQSERAVSSMDEEAIENILNDLCILINYSVTSLSTIKFSNANSTTVNRLTFILKATVSCASHITASENLLWETTNKGVISKIISLTRSLSSLPEGLVDICQKSSHATFLYKGLSDSEYIVYTALSTLLMLLRRCNIGSLETSRDNGDVDDDSDMMDMVHQVSISDAMWDSIITQVSEKIAGVFLEPEDSGDDLQRRHSVFVKYSFPIRMLILDIWYYCRFTNFEEVAEDAIVCVTGVDCVTTVEHEKMLYLLFMRRGEVGVDAFISSMLRGIESSVGLIYENFSHSMSELDVSTPNRTERGENEESLMLEFAGKVNSSEWCVHKIADTLYRCGSSSSPHVIAKYVLNSIQGLFADVVDDGTDLYCYGVGIISVCQALLKPFYEDNATTNGSSEIVKVEPIVEILNIATDLVTDVLIKLLLCHSINGISSKFLRLGFRLLREDEPYADSLLCPILNALTSQWKVKRNDADSEVFDMFLIVLRKVSLEIPRYGIEEIFSLSENMYEIVQFWKLSENSCFGLYKNALTENVRKWHLLESVCRNDETKERIGDLIVFITND